MTTTDDQLACITNTLRDFRGCTIRDQHWDDLLAADPDHGDTCHGCLPRRAAVGFVCHQCFGHIEGALRTWHTWSRLLEGVDRAAHQDAAGAPGKPESRPPLSPIALGMDELRSYLRTYSGTPERWVASEAGATDAVRFARAMHANAAAHPIAETTHHIPRTRCPRCEKLSLRWHPPAYFGAQVRVACRDQTCGFEADQTSFETIAAIETRTAVTR